MTMATIDLFHPVHLPEMEAAALEVMRSGQIASGPKVSALERALSPVVGREHIVSTSDLTSAVTLALHLAGVRPGDEVATIAFSCLQSNSPIVRLGARPVWIDIDPITMTMSPEDLAAKLKPSVKAVMVYHVAGYPADIPRIAALCRDGGIPLIEDCNAAIGARFDGRPVGKTGTFSVYSLYPNRQINGLDGGILACPDAATAERARRLRRYGIDASTFRDYRGEINPDSDVPEIGFSASLSQFHAAVALAQLPTLAERTQRTQDNANALLSALAHATGIRVIQPITGAQPAYWGLLLGVDQRDKLLLALKDRGIQCSVLHQRNDSYSGFWSALDELPGTADAMDHLLAIPCGWWLSKEQTNQIVMAIRSFDPECSDRC